MASRVKKSTQNYKETYLRFSFVSETIVVLEVVASTLFPTLRPGAISPQDLRDLSQHQTDLFFPNLLSFSLQIEVFWLKVRKCENVQVLRRKVGKRSKND